MRLARGTRDRLYPVGQSERGADNFAAEDFFVVLERRFAVTIKAKIRDEIGCHFANPFRLLLNSSLM